MMRKIVTGIAVALVSILLPAQGQAILTHTLRSTWEIAAGVFDEAGPVESWEADLSGIPNGTAVHSIALPFSQFLDFSVTLDKRTVGAGWNTWAPGETPADIDDDPVEVLTTLTFAGFANSFSGSFPTGPVAAFGMEMEPNDFGLHIMTLTLSDGSQISQPVIGNAGAKFFGWTDGAVTGWTAHCDECGGFAIGDIVKAEAIEVSEPGALLLLGSGLVALGAWRRLQT